jgi:hypothetical protein
MREKISSSQIDKNDTLFLLPGDKAIQDADQNIVRTIDGKVLDKFKEAYGYSSIYGNQDTDVIYIQELVERLQPCYHSSATYQSSHKLLTTIQIHQQSLWS